MRTADSSSIAFCMFVIMIAAWKSCVDIGDIEDQTTRIADSLENIEKTREKCTVQETKSP